MREKELCVNQKIHIYLRKNHRFNIFGISFQRFHHRPSTPCVGEPIGASWACCWTASSGTPVSCAQDLDDVLGGPHGQVQSGRNDLCVVALPPQGQYPHFVFNIDRKMFIYKNCRSSSKSHVLAFFCTTLRP